MSQRHGEAVEDSPSSIEPSLFKAGEAYEPYRNSQDLKVPMLDFDMEQSARVGEIDTNLQQHLKQSYGGA